MSLEQQTCTACRVGAPPLEGKALDQALAELPQWQLEDISNEPKLSRKFSFKDFNEATGFVMRVALLAEQYDHHPRVTLEWGCVCVQWWTHKIQGIHKNDAILAAKTDQLIKKS